ncbi:hypothetical protein chiPu_0023623, partial [Chiloscyllium punctatum]|nr:hypothetical protein [Chiloscyllium punctatum]
RDEEGAVFRYWSPCLQRFLPCAVFLLYSQVEAGVSALGDSEIVSMRCCPSVHRFCKSSLMICNFMKTVAEEVLVVCIEQHGYLKTKRWL